MIPSCIGKCEDILLFASNSSSISKSCCLCFLTVLRGGTHPASSAQKLLLTLHSGNHRKWGLCPGARGTKREVEILVGCMWGKHYPPCAITLAPNSVTFTNMNNTYMILWYPIWNLPRFPSLYTPLLHPIPKLPGREQCVLVDLSTCSNAPQLLPNLYWKSCLTLSFYNINYFRSLQFS